MCGPHGSVDLVAIATEHRRSTVSTNRTGSRSSGLLPPTEGGADGGAARSELESVPCGQTRVGGVSTVSVGSREDAVMLCLAPGVPPGSLGGGGPGLHQRIGLGVGPCTPALFLQAAQRGGGALQQRVPGAPLAAGGGVAAGAGGEGGGGRGRQGPLGQGGGARAQAQAAEARVAQRQGLLGGV